MPGLVDGLSAYARSYEQPANYAQVRIIPPSGVKSTTATSSNSRIIVYSAATSTVPTSIISIGDELHVTLKAGYPAFGMFDRFRRPTLADAPGSEFVSPSPRASPTRRRPGIRDKFAPVADVDRQGATGRRAGPLVPGYDDVRAVLAQTGVRRCATFTRRTSRWPRSSRRLQGGRRGRRASPSTPYRG